MSPLINIQNISLKIESKKILSDLSFQIKENQFISILGPNGSGKTTLLKTLIGLIHPEFGSICIQDKNIQTIPAEEKSKLIAWVPEDTYVPFSYTALEIVLMGRFPYHKGFPQKLDFEKSLEALTTIGIEQLSEQNIMTMSSGERRKVMIARALAGESPIIILDEPLANLDITASISILKELAKLSYHGRTIIASMHDLSLARLYTSHCLLLKSGKKVDSGLSKEVIQQDNIESVYRIKACLLNDDYGTEHLVIES